MRVVFVKDSHSSFGKTLTQWVPCSVFTWVRLLGTPREQGPKWHWLQQCWQQWKRLLNCSKPRRAEPMCANGNMPKVSRGFGFLKFLPLFLSFVTKVPRGHSVCSCCRLKCLFSCNSVWGCLGLSGVLCILGPATNTTLAQTWNGSSKTISSTPQGKLTSVLLVAFTSI